MTGFDRKFFDEAVFAAEFGACLGREALALRETCLARGDHGTALVALLTAIKHHRLARKETLDAGAELAAYMAREAFTLRPLRVRRVKGRP